MNESTEPSWEDREVLTQAIQRLHLVDLNNLYEIVDAVVEAGWRPLAADRSE
jgi:hypothetical protein